MAFDQNSFFMIFRGCWTSEGIAGSDGIIWVSTNGLLGTLVTKLYDTHHANSSVTTRTGHRDPKSLKVVKNILGNEKCNQHRDIKQSIQDFGNNCSFHGPGIKFLSSCLVEADRTTKCTGSVSLHGGTFCAIL